MADLHSHHPGVGMTTTCRRGNHGAGSPALGKPAPLAQVQTRLLRHPRAGGKPHPLPLTLRRRVPLCNRAGGMLARLVQTPLLQQCRSVSEKLAPSPQMLHPRVLLWAHVAAALVEAAHQRVASVAGGMKLAHRAAGVHQAALRRSCSADELP